MKTTHYHCKIILIVFSFLNNLHELVAIIQAPSIESKKKNRNSNYIAFRKEIQRNSTTKNIIPKYVSEQCGRDRAKTFQRKTLFLICSKDKNHLEEISKLRNHGFHTNVTYLSHNFPLTCPCAYDHTGLCRQKPHMCTASMSSYYCNFKLSSVILSTKGGLIDCRTLSPISFSHPSIGLNPPIYDDSKFKKWHDYYTEEALNGISSIKEKQKENKLGLLNMYDLVVPTRMIWDDVFNHISFQSIPLIAHIKTFCTEIWYNITWHSSLQTAAILKLLDVKDDKIIIEKSVYAKNVIFPWVPGWCPLQTATLHGVASNLTNQITAKLLSFNYDKAPYINNNLTGSNFTVQKNATKRFIVYLRRPQGARRVYNEIEIIKLIKLYLHEDYELYILGHIDAINTIKGLHESWARNAAIFSRAKLVLGPHGGAFNHMIWTPSDTHFIEFNLFPDDLKSSDSHGGLPVRSIYLAAFWAKGGSGKFYIISPSIMHPLDFYAGKMRIAPKELFDVFIDVGGLLNDRKINFSSEIHRVWNKTEQLIIKFK
mmetsp:Transcript_20152/g.19464  ORF Transcript_20152/g.19464 Transcript_20152/m.19464 type:complete len:540 (+) Transcript_20152:116-1735(+)